MATTDAQLALAEVKLAAAARNPRERADPWTTWTCCPARVRAADGP